MCMSDLCAIQTDICMSDLCGWALYQVLLEGQSLVGVGWEQGVRGALSVTLPAEIACCHY